MAFLVPDGVGFRNFVIGSFLREAASLGQVDVFHFANEDALPRCAKSSDDSVRWHRLLPFGDSPLHFILRQALTTAQMHWVGTPPMMDQLKRTVSGSISRRSALKTARWMGRRIASPAGMRWMERVHSTVVGWSQEVAHFRQLFQEIRPDVVFSSNQHPVFVIPPVIAAKQLGIPTATFIFSWDNLSSKGRIAAPFDHFLVWSDHMRKELHRFYPDISAHRSHVIGTPQFDPYGDKRLLWTRAEFFRQIGADPKRKLICFSGGDEYTSKGDQYHLRALMELIRSGRVAGNPQVVVRPSPMDRGMRYDSVRQDFPELIYMRPKWLAPKTAFDFYGIMPSAEDVEFLANLTHHADLNVNFASTMTLDFAIHDRPIVNVLFEVADPPLMGTSMWDFVRGFQHYDPVFDFGAARIARTVDQFADHVNAYLQDPSLDREGRRRFVELEIGAPIGQSSKLMLQALQKIAGRPHEQRKAS